MEKNLDDGSAADADAGCLLDQFVLIGSEIDSSVF
jgi:hypothetical protein